MIQKKFAAALLLGLSQLRLLGLSGLLVGLFGPLGAAWAVDNKSAFRADATKGQALATTCLACHTADGTRGSPANPILQGQHPEYIVKQLQEFKSGKRRNAVMTGMASALSDEDMKHLAAFYGGKKAKPGFAKSKETLALGEKIYRGGILERQIPACAGCHSPSGAGIPAQYPRVGSQHGDYTEAQLLAFRSGARGNSAQMVAITAKMNDREIKAVADYIAGLR